MNHFIKNIEIENFKCFNGFKADAFERVNLIGGKNNIGKTAFMEACYVNVCSVDLRTMLGAMLSIKFMRENLNLLLDLSTPHDLLRRYVEQCDGISTKTNITENKFRIRDENGALTYEFQFGEGRVVANRNDDFSYDGKEPIHIKFIDNLGWSDGDISSCYSEVQRKDKETYIDSLIHDFDPDIDGFKVIEDKPMCKTDGNYRNVTEFGDGVRHLLSVATSFFAAENGYVFIDEIDNGIHYTMLDLIWKFVFELAEEFNVQVFATTHSLECISSFNRIQMEKADTNSTYFEMAKEKATNEIFMTALDPEQLEYELEHGGRFRGE